MVIFVVSPILAVFCLGLFVIAIMAVKRLNVEYDDFTALALSALT